MVMRTVRPHRVIVAGAAALLVAGFAGPVHAAGAATWLTASPTASKIQLAAGGSVVVTVTNTDRRATSAPLTVTLGRNPATAPFSIVANSCAGVALRPQGSCAVEVAYQGPAPTSDHAASLTVSSGKPMKASVTRILEVGVGFADVCVVRGGIAGYGGSVTILGATFAVAERCDWADPLAVAVYNANFEALSPECFDLSDNGTVGYTVNSQTGRPTIACVAG